LNPFLIKLWVRYRENGLSVSHDHLILYFRLTTCITLGIHLMEFRVTRNEKEIIKTSRRHISVSHCTTWGMPNVYHFDTGLK